MPQEQFDVAIVGAGAAGLCAASDLSAAGFRVLVIEARNRIGGRIFTQTNDLLPLPVELGAEFIHGKHPDLFAAIEGARALICDAADRHWYLKNGHLVRTEEFQNRLNALFQAMEHANQPDRSFQEFINSLPADPETRETKSIACRFIEGFHAASTRRVGIQGLVKVNKAADEIDGDKSFRILSGYQRIVDWYAHEAQLHGAEIILSTVLREVRWSDGYVEISCQGNGTSTRDFTARNLLVTLPLGVLQADPDEIGAVRFRPDLPDSKQRAIGSLAMGQAIRIALQFRDRFWEQLKLPHDGHQESLEQLGFIHTSGVPFSTWWTMLPVRAPLLIGWVGGTAAETLIGNDDFITKKALESLAAVLAVSEDFLSERLEATHLHNWHSDPFTRGAYSYLPVGGVAAQAELAKPVADTIFFAGEATSIDGHIGTVHGAIASGKRAASEIANLPIAN